jgi:diketogulonate reductase-like aldo/keto reductase
MTTVPNVRLNNGVDIPQLGFGVFQIRTSAYWVRKGASAAPWSLPH